MTETNCKATIISQSYEGEKVVESHDHLRAERIKHIKRNLDRELGKFDYTYCQDWVHI